MSPFWLLVFGMLIVWVVASGRANAFLNAVLYGDNSAAQPKQPQPGPGG